MSLASCPLTCCCTRKHDVQRDCFAHTLMTFLWVLALTPLPHQPLPPRHNVLRGLLTRRRQGASVGHHTLCTNSVCLENLAVRDCRTCFQCLALPHLLAGYPWSPSGSFLGASREKWGQLGCPAKWPLFCFPVFIPQSLLYISLYNFCHLRSLRYFSSPCLLFTFPPSVHVFLIFFNMFCFVLASVGDGLLPIPITKTNKHGDRGQKQITLERYKTKKNMAMFSWYAFPTITLS